MAMANKEHNKFWMVWSPEGRDPTYQHLSRGAAEREAERLAGMNPGRRFFVLKAVSGVMTEVSPVLNIKLRPANDDEIPF